MAQNKKVLITLPDALLSEADRMAGQDHICRSEFIREAMRHYIKERRRKEISEKMKQGYIDMASINLSIAEEWLQADEKQLFTYEELLSQAERNKG